MKNDAQLVIFHTKKKAKKGKNPSLPYRGERNPRKALLLALADIEERKATPTLNRQRSFVGDPFSPYWGIGTGHFCPDCGGLCGNSNHDRRL